MTSILMRAYYFNLLLICVDMAIQILQHITVHSTQNLIYRPAVRLGLSIARVQLERGKGEEGKVKVLSRAL